MSESLKWIEAGKLMAEGFKAGIAEAEANPLSPPGATYEERAAAFVAHYGPDGPGAAFMERVRGMNRLSLWGLDANEGEDGIPDRQ